MDLILYVLASLTVGFLLWAFFDWREQEKAAKASEVRLKREIENVIKLRGRR